MASIVAGGRTASKLLSNETFDMAMVGLGAFAVWEFWPLIKPFFNIGVDATEGLNKLIDSGGKVVDSTLSDIGKIAGGDKDTGEGIVENVAIGTIGPIGAIASALGFGGNKKETDLQKRIDQYEKMKGKTIISNDDASRNLWSNVIEKNMTFKNALTQHMKDMNGAYPDLMYSVKIDNSMTISTLSFSDGVKIWDAYQGIAYISKRHQSDVFERPVSNGERQRFISDALIAEGIPNPDYFINSSSESQLVIYNDVSMVYIAPRWHFQPA